MALSSPGLGLRLFGKALAYRLPLIAEVQGSDPPGNEEQSAQHQDTPNVIGNVDKEDLPALEVQVKGASYCMRVCLM
jgi:hypothetical protein